MKPSNTGALLGLCCTLPLLGIINLLHETIGHMYLPVELIHSTFGLVLMDAILFAEPLALSIPLLLWGVGICMVAYRRAHRAAQPPSRLHGVLLGLLFGLPLLLALPWLAEQWHELVIGLAVIGGFFALWGLLCAAAMERVLIWQGCVAASTQNNLQETRRQLLYRGLGIAILLTMVTTGGTALLHRRRRNRLSAQMRLPDHIPSQLVARVYPSQPTAREPFTYPEQQYTRYQPANHPIGVAFSGGGPRAMSCALGQMRGLVQADLLSSIGAISCVSGGGWFGTIFTYASTTISDDALLGAFVPPEALTVEALHTVEPTLAAAPLTTMTDKWMLLAARDIMRGISITDSPFNRFWARLLNQSLLAPFALDDYHRFFTLDADTVTDIGRRNPALAAGHFYTARPDRPYLICSSTHLYPPGPEQALRHFSFTPLYTGMQQLFPQSGVAQSDLGGGFIETFAFDSQSPLAVGDTNLVTVATPEPIFALCDMIAATSAAAGLLVNHYRQPHFMSQFHLWPLGTQERADLYSIVDGNGIDNTGIVPLLRRHYPIILAFVNAAIPLGDPGPAAARGVSSEIARLFGVNVPLEADRDPTLSQIFPREQFTAVADGLQAAHAAGHTPLYVGQHNLIQPNAFDIPAYPGDGKVTVIWVYNDRNPEWYSRLPAPIQALLNQSTPTNRLDNFPHFDTIGQNESDAGLPQVLCYTPEQVNLLAHMWSYTVVTDVAEEVAAQLETFAADVR